VAEYLALRSEIEWLIKDGSQYQSFAIALLAAALPVLQFLSERNQLVFLVALLLIPFLFCLLGFLYFRQHEEVYVIAAYLKESLRPRVRALTGDDKLWAWEEFKHDHATSIGRLMTWISRGHTFFILRALLFALPSILAVSVASVLMSRGRPYVPQSWEARALMLAGLALDAIVTGLLILFLAARGDFAHRILGIDGLEASRLPGAPQRPLWWFTDRAMRSARGAFAALAGGLARLRRGRRE